MKNFVAKTTVFMLVLCGVLIINVFKPPHEGSSFMYNYMRGLEFKEKLAKSLEHHNKRILLVGGSNLNFGIESEILSEYLKTPVINMGLNGGLGYEFIFKQASEIAKQGDIIFLSIEYEMDNFMDQSLRVGLSETSDYFHFKYNSGKTLDNFVRFFHRVKGASKFILNFNFESRIDKHISELYNSNGDYIYHRNLVPQKKIKGFNTNYNYNVEEWSRSIEIFKSEMNKKGITVYYLYPSYEKEYFASNQHKLSNYIREINIIFSKHQIGEQTNYLFSKNFFFDHICHMTFEGRRKRTLQLKQDLNRLEIP